MNIRNQKGIRKHISELITENLIQKKMVGRGHSDQYYLENTFTSFRNCFNCLHENRADEPAKRAKEGRSCFNYLHENGSSVDFLKTSFSRNLSSSDEFFFFGLVNIVKVTVLDLISLMKDESRVNDLLLEAKKEGMNEQVDMMKEMRARLLIEPNISELYEFVSGLTTNTAEELITRVQDIFPIPIKPVLSEIINQIFSRRQKEEIMNILFTSPSAMDYFLNLKTEDKPRFLAILIRFFFGIAYVDPSKADIIASFNKEPDKKKALSFITELLSQKNIVNDNPILTTLKAHFIIDAVNGKIIENEYSTKALQNILLPEVAQ